MIANLLTPITHNDEALKGISRSRFSFHFNTPRTRRWFIVQLVSAPAVPAGDQSSQRTPYIMPQPDRLDYAQLLENFQSSRISTRCI